MFWLTIAVFLTAGFIPETTAGGCVAQEECSGCDETTYKKYPLCANGTCVCNAIPSVKQCDTWVNCSQTDCTPFGKIRSCQHGICTCKDCRVGHEPECDCQYGRSCVEGTCSCKEAECKSDTECPACNDALKKYALCSKGVCVCNAIPTQNVCSTWVNCKQADCTEMGKIRSCQHGICTCKNCTVGREAECGCKGIKSCVDGTCACEDKQQPENNSV